jgi:vacuolar-type H+-ATPase subunit H
MEHPTGMNEDNFEIVMRGYNKRQVDDFVGQSRTQARDLEERLGRALDALEHTRRELAEAREQASAKPAHEEVSERLSQILRLAAEEADQERAKADEDIARVRADADTEVQRILEDARGESEWIIKSAREDAERDVAAAREEAERLLSSHREEADRTLTSAQERANRVLGEAERRATAINEGSEQRLDTLIATHGEAVRRLAEVRDVLHDLLGRDDEAGPLDASVEAIIARSRSEAGELSMAELAGMEPAAGQAAEAANGAVAAAEGAESEDTATTESLDLELEPVEVVEVEQDADTEIDAEAAAAAEAVEAVTQRVKAAAD